MYGIASELYGTPNRIWNVLPAAFKDHYQMGQIMDIRKVDAVHDHHCLDGFLGGLLGIEAQVFQVDVRYKVLRLCQVCFWRGSAIPVGRRAENVQTTS